jgi:predicted nucleic acid-binding protein
MPKIILTDTCYWLGLIDSEDQYHNDSVAVSRLINDYKIIVPWPCLYETISTRLVRNYERLTIFEKLLKKPGIELLDDTKYKNAALNEVFEFNRNNGFTFSLADSVIREMLKDINIRVNYFVTFNNRDFYDVCTKRQIEIIQ